MQLKRLFQWYRPNMGLVFPDLRLVGKSLIAVFFAIVFWPGDKGDVKQALVYLIIGVLVYIIGLNEPAKKPEVHS